MKKTLLILFLLMVVIFCSCGDEREADNKKEAVIGTSEAVTDFLTGKKKQQGEKLQPRPVAVMVNNIDDSLPQYGISEADVIVEMPVEGGITRLMAIYSDFRKVPSVCSVRSCRYYFPLIAMGFDAVYFCFGSNELLGTPTLEKSGIDYIDGSATNEELLFQRDKERLATYSPEHTVCLMGENLEKIFDDYLFRKTTDKRDVFLFSDERVKSDFECTGATGSFSFSYHSGFDFDSEEGEYTKTHNGTAHIDEKSLKQLSFTNVFLLKSNTGLYKDTNLVEIDLRGGEGYYLTEGSVKKIKWKKKNASSPVEFFDSGGEALKINKGKSYIGIGVEEIILSRQSEN